MRIVPPVPFTSSSTLSGVDLWTRTNSAELFGVKVAANLHELIVDPPDRPMLRTPPPPTTPTARPRSGFRNISPISIPQHPPLVATRGRQIDGLVELDFALGVFGHGHGVLQVDQVIPLQFDQGERTSSAL